MGNTVDVKTATYSNDSIGVSQLRAVWIDPDFETAMFAASSVAADSPGELTVSGDYIP